MAKKIKLSQLSTEIENIVQDYSKELIDVGNKITIKHANLIKNEIAINNPQNTGKMATGWQVNEEFTGLKVKTTIHNTTKPTLTHLLENGTYKMAARPFIVPAYNLGTPRFINDLQNNLKKVGK